MRVSILDLAPIAPGHTAADSFAGSVALASMGDRPIRAAATEAALREGAGIDDAAALAADGTSPQEDLHADAVYRRHLARVLTGRALSSAAVAP